MFLVRRLALRAAAAGGSAAAAAAAAAGARAAAAAVTAAAAAAAAASAPTSSNHAAGAPELRIELEQASGTAALIDALQAQYPQLETILPRCALAVNGEYTQTTETILSEGDEVALLPPMSGG